MDPLAIYISLFVLALALMICARIWRHTPTRKCHLCSAQVELGRGRCQVCNYRFED